MSSIKKPAFPTPLLNDRVSLIAAQLETTNPPSNQALLDDGESEEDIQLAIADVLYHRVRLKLCRKETLTLPEELDEATINNANELQAKIEQFIAFYEEEPAEEFAQKLEERIESFTPRLILKAKAFYEEMRPYQETTPSPTMLHQFDPEYSSQSSVQSELEDRSETSSIPFTLRLNFQSK